MRSGPKVVEAGYVSKESVKKYKCPCGSSMTRSDALLRHTRICSQAEELMNRQPPTTRQRTKSACDRCAISRHKCDKGNPCLNCRKRSIECSYTRDGYEDAYQAFRQHDSPRKDDDSPQPMPQLQEDISTATVDIDLLPTISGGIFDTIDWDALIAFPVLDAQTLPPDPIATQTDCAPITEANVPDTSLLHHTNDALSAKCVEIETYIASFHSGVDQSALIDLITQETLNNCMTAYFDHFESIQALIHRPTFNITTTPPQLLTAMMLVGACYAHNAIPPEAIIQGAIHVLLLLQHSAHERAMTKPPLASIQANSLLCQILLLTKSPQAYAFAMVHRARSLSMADRAGIFQIKKDINYHELDITSFDWPSWAAQEMRKRLAHYIFIDSIGNSIFARTATHVSPFNYPVSSPCYNDCWTAGTAAECLHFLQARPQSITLTTSLKMLRLAPPSSAWLFEASDGGMLQSIMAIHSMLFRTMEQELESDSIIPEDVTAPMISNLLRQNFPGEHVASSVDQYASQYASMAIMQINAALAAWRRNWDSRKQLDHQNDIQRGFVHPLNFWYLAKLFILLHLRRRHHPEDEGMALFYQNEASLQNKLQTQVQVIAWMGRLRQLDDKNLASAGSFLSQVLNS